MAEKLPSDWARACVHAIGDTFVKRKAEEMYTLQREESSACLREKSKGGVGERSAGQCLAVSSDGLLSLAGQCLVGDRNHGVELERDQTVSSRAVSVEEIGWWRGVGLCAHWSAGQCLVTSGVRGAASVGPIANVAIKDVLSRAQSTGSVCWLFVLLSRVRLAGQCLASSSYRGCDATDRGFDYLKFLPNLEVVAKRFRERFGPFGLAMPTSHSSEFEGTAKRNSGISDAP